MKSFFSLLLIVLSTFTFSQRITFNDPDLTFSFVKPADWMVQDDLVVKATPSNQSFESATTFFSITYYEDPEKPEEATIELVDSDVTSPPIPPNLQEFKAGAGGKTDIAEETAHWTSYYHTQDAIRIKAVSYRFMKFNQRFEITVSAPISSFEQMEKELEAILSSIKIEK